MEENEFEAQDADERRAWVRFPSGVTGSCQPVPLPTADRKEKAWAATIRDISRDGICLDLSRRFETGTVLILELPASRGGAEKTQTVQVVRIAGKTQNGWAVACRFEVPLADEELRNLAPESALSGHAVSRG